MKYLTAFCYTQNYIRLKVSRLKFSVSIILAAGVCLFSRCDKGALDITPDGRISLNEVFIDNERTGAYLNSCYAFIPPYGFNYYWWTNLPIGSSDDAHDNDAPTENLPGTWWYNGNLTPASNPWDIHDGASFWNGSYYLKYWQGIRKANVFLANIDNANVTNPSNRARWKAEAKLLRAFYYWELIKMFGGMPIASEAYSLDFDFLSLPRAPFSECVDFIIRDCEEALAEPNLPWRIDAAPDRGRFTKAVAHAIISEAALFNASPLWNPANDASKWMAAAEKSARAIRELSANGFSLYPDYRNYFLITPDLGQNPADKETLLEVKENSGLGIAHQINGLPSMSGVVKPGITPSQELVDAYEMRNGEPAILGYSDEDHLQPIINVASGYDESKPYLNRDPRFYATVFYNGALYGKINGQDYYVESFQGGADGIRQNDRRFTHNGYYMKKYIDTTLVVGQSSSSKWRRYRLAQVYLDLAEAENEANGPTQVAYDAINAIRRRAGMPELPTGLNQDEFRKRIRNERRVELAFEENRFWDVRRWKILEQTGKLTTGMMWVKEADNSLTGTRMVVLRRVPWQDKYLIFPIPEREVVSLPAFEQNPGW